MAMGDHDLVEILEGALLAADEPLTKKQLAQLFDELDRPSASDITTALDEVASRCDGRGFELAEVASGFRFQVRQHLSPWVSKLWVERPARYSRAHSKPRRYKFTFFVRRPGCFPLLPACRSRFSATFFVGR